MLLPQFGSECSRRCSAEPVLHDMLVDGLSLPEVSGNGGDPFDVFSSGRAVWWVHRDKLCRHGEDIGLRGAVVTPGRFCFPRSPEAAPLRALHRPSSALYGT